MRALGGGLDEGVTNGRAAAILLARAGAKVCVAGRTLALAQHTVDLIKKEGGEAFAHQADVTKEADCRAVAAEYCHSTAAPHTMQAKAAL